MPAWFWLLLLLRPPPKMLGVEEHPGQQPGDHPEPAGDGHDGHVAVGHVRQLVREHGFDLGLVEAAQQPRRHADDGGLGTAPRGERVGDVGGRDGDAWLGHVGQRAEPVDDAVQLGRLLGRDLLGVHGVHGDLGAEPVLAEDQDKGDDQHQGVGEADRDQDPDDEAVEEDEEEPRQEHPVGEAPVGLDIA